MIDNSLSQSIFSSIVLKDKFLFKGLNVQISFYAELTFKYCTISCLCKHLLSIKIRPAVFASEFFLLFYSWWNNNRNFLALHRSVNQSVHDYKFRKKKIIYRIMKWENGTWLSICLKISQSTSACWYLIQRKSIIALQYRLLHSIFDNIWLHFIIDSIEVQATNNPIPYRLHLRTDWLSFQKFMWVSFKL